MKLGFDLLFDPGNKVAEAYGIAMELPDDLIKVYTNRGIDLPTFDGDNSWRLPSARPHRAGERRRGARDRSGPGLHTPAGAGGDALKTVGGRFFVPVPWLPQ
jgi:hypothetical protein